MRSVMLSSVIALAILGGSGLVSASPPGVQDKHPVYVGVQVCARCHASQACGHQFSLWRASTHARSFAALCSPQAKKIARLSGIPEEPWKATLCLGCHATAAQAEEWEKEDTFVFEDGVQCEQCHGAGSEYATFEVMMDRPNAMLSGLKMPGERDCMICHNVKGSHVAVLGSPVFDVKAGLKLIAHPTPAQTSNPPKRPAAPTTRPADTPAKAAAASDSSGPRYTGVMACAQCHQGPMMGHQFSKWRMSRHARAYAVLGTPLGREMAIKEGVKDDPQTSSQCLKCHSTGSGLPGGRFLEQFDVREGVQCEACHGRGSEYSAEAVMRDRKAAQKAGLERITEKTCLVCHDNAHERKFDYAAGVKTIAHPTRFAAAPTTQAAGPRYKTPLNLALSPDGKELYVACEASDSVIVVDVSAPSESKPSAPGLYPSAKAEGSGLTAAVAEAYKVVAEIHTGGQPNDVCFSPDGGRAYVTNRLDDSLAIIDTATRKVMRTVPVGDEPHGVLADPSGKRIYVLNTSADSISVLDADSLKEVGRLSASRGPWSLAVSPDGQQIVITNSLSRFVKFRTSSLSEVTVLDHGGAVVDRRVEVPDANLLQGVAWHPSGRFALVTLMRTKNLVPLTRLLQGWTVTNGLGVIWRDGRVDQVLLDEPHLCFPDPADVAVSPDGKYAFVTSSGSDRVAVVDVAKLVSTIESGTPHERVHVLPNHLGKPTEFIVKHIPTKNSPRGVVFSHDGRTAYVANALDDSVTVIDVTRLEAVARIDLGGPKEITSVRRGERLFHSANIAFHRQFSCHSCHPDGHVNGLTFDLEPDGIGELPVDNRTLRGILDTAPFKWEGTNPTLQRECGPRLAVFFTRIQPFTPDELTALTDYICTIPRPPNRYRPLGGALTAAQRRGKAVFERAMTNDRRMIPVENRCITCHPPPYYTDRSRRDIGTRMQFDNESLFDVPHLNNIYDSAPYLHNGMAETLEEIWTRYNLYDRHGITNDMTKDQLNDLIEYLKTL